MGFIEHIPKILFDNDVKLLFGRVPGSVVWGFFLGLGRGGGWVSFKHGDIEGSQQLHRGVILFGRQLLGL